MYLILIIVLILLISGGGYGWHQGYLASPYYGGGILGLILIVAVVLWLVRWI